MPMKPGADEGQDEFMGRCVPDMMDGGRDNDQAVAICMDIWNRNGFAPVVHKTSTSVPTVVRSSSDDVDFEYVLSDGSTDRYGDTIQQDGWDLRQFQNNPIALFNHNSDFPIGKWINLRVDRVTNQLRGKLVLAKRGTSSRIDELRALLSQGILKAVSVGFRVHEKAPTQKGMTYKKQELLECSLVSIPANPNALQVARSLKVSRSTMALVFGESADRTLRTSDRVSRAGQGDPPSHRRTSAMPEPKTLSRRIEEAEQKLTSLQDELQNHLDGLGEEPDEAAAQVTDDLNAKIDSVQRNLSTLKASEQRLVRNVEQRTSERGDRQDRNASMGDDQRRPFAIPAKKVEPIDYVYRALTVAVKNHATKNPLTDTLKSTYGEDVVTKAVMDNIIQRAATVPADTATPAWASALVQTAIGDFFDVLMPASVYPGLTAQGGRYTFGRNGVISLPTRSATPTVAGSFVAQGAPIPVRQAAFASVTLTPKKMGVITTMTREIMEHSTPAIEAILRQSMQEDTSVAIDSVLLDANAATTVRPAGIANGATTAAGTAGGGFAAVVADLKGMLGSLIAATAGNLRNPVWIMNPSQSIALALTQNAGGDFPFKAEVNAGRFQGYPLIVSPTVTAGTVFLLDAADFFSATGDDPRFDVSDQAVLHMEDTTPLAIGTVGSPATVAAPVRSLWQTDTLAIRMLLDLNWAFRRTGVVVTRTAVTW